MPFIIPQYNPNQLDQSLALQLRNQATSQGIQNDAINQAIAQQQASDQSRAAQDIHNQIPLQDAIKKLALRQQGVFISPQVAGQPASVPAIPIAPNSDINKALMANQDTNNFTPIAGQNVTDNNPLIAPDLTKGAPLPQVIGPGQVYDPLTASDFRKNQFDIKRAQEKILEGDKSDIQQSREIAVQKERLENAAKNKPVNVHVVGNHIITKDAISGETLSDEVVPAGKVVHSDSSGLYVGDPNDITSFQKIPGSGKQTAETKSEKLSANEDKMLESAATSGQTLSRAIQIYDDLASKNEAGPVAGRVSNARSNLGLGTKDYTEAQAQIKNILYQKARALHGAGVLRQQDLETASQFSPRLDTNRDQFVGSVSGVAQNYLDQLDGFLAVKGNLLTPKQLGNLQSIRSDLETVKSGGTTPKAPLGAAQIPSYSSVEQAEAAGHQAGEKVIVNGQVGTLKAH